MGGRKDMRQLEGRGRTARASNLRSDYASDMLVDGLWAIATSDGVGGWIIDAVTLRVDRLRA